MKRATVRLYVYNWSGLTPDQQRVVACAFDRAGYDPKQLFLTPSIVEAVDQLPPHAALVVYSLKECGGLNELIDLLLYMQERHAVLRSLKEPWLNEALLDCAYSVTKLKPFTQNL